MRIGYTFLFLKSQNIKIKLKGLINEQYLILLN
jgi:hypothetical protein